MGNYLIPANSKKSMLILNMFTPLDLIIFGTGVLMTVIMLMSIRTNSLVELLGILLPSLITGLLVMPLPYYHNVRTLIKNICIYFWNRKDFRWKGWCIEKYGQE